MFDPSTAVKTLLDQAYLSGSDYAGSIFPSAPVPDDPEWREQVRDIHAAALVRSVQNNPHLNGEALGPGIYASVFSGFEDHWNHLTMPIEDIEAISMAADEMAASLETDRKTTFAVFASPGERWPAPRFDGLSPEQEGLAVQFAMETVRRPLTPVRILQMAKELYEAETRGGS